MVHSLPLEEGLPEIHRLIQLHFLRRREASRRTRGRTDGRTDEPFSCDEAPGAASLLQPACLPTCLSVCLSSLLLFSNKKNNKKTTNDWWVKKKKKKKKKVFIFMNFTQVF